MPVQMGHPINWQEVLAEVICHVVDCDIFLLFLSEVIANDVDQHVLHFDASEKVTRHFIVLVESQQLPDLVLHQDRVEIGFVRIRLKLGQDRLLIGRKRPHLRNNLFLDFVHETLEKQIIEYLDCNLKSI